MHKILISIPDNLAYRLRVVIPARQREKNLYTCALEVEKDKALNKEMKAWDITTNDGLKESKYE